MTEPTQEARDAMIRRAYEKSREEKAVEQEFEQYLDEQCLIDVAREERAFKRHCGLIDD